LAHKDPSDVTQDLLESLVLPQDIAKALEGSIPAPSDHLWIPRAKRPVEAVNDPHRLASIFLKPYQHEAHSTLRHWRDDWWLWREGRYSKTSHRHLQAEVTRLAKREFDNSEQRDRNGHVLKVTRSLVENVLQALMSMVEVPPDVEQPCWLGGRKKRNLLALKNGLIDLDQLRAKGASNLEQHSPKWFSTVRLSYDYKPGASCPKWRAFLKRVLEEDGERIAQLQEWFGYLDDQQEQELFKAADPHLRAVVLAMLETCCRPGEILSLQWKDVDLARREMRIRWSKAKDREDRMIPITSNLAATLEMRRHDPAGQELGPEAYVFGDELGNRCKSVRQAWEKARNAAGLVGLHLADLRHEAASRWEEAGVHPRRQQDARAHEPEDHNDLHQRERAAASQCCQEVRGSSSGPPC
jgi:integrase